MLCLRSSWTCRTATATATAPTSRRRTRHSSPVTAPGLLTLTSFSPSSSPHAAQGFKLQFLPTRLFSKPPALQQLRRSFLAWGCHSATRVEVVSSVFFSVLVFRTDPIRSALRSACQLHFYAVAVIYISYFLFTFLSAIHFIFIIYSL